MTVAIQTDRIYTYDELATMPDELARHEIIGGELVVSPGASYAHQAVSGELFYLLKRFVREHQLGVVLTAPFDVKFSPHNVVEPDILFVSNQRREILQAKFATAAPDLVVEVISESSYRRDHVQKRALYAMGGVPEYWLVDPTNRTVAVLTLADEQYTPVSANDAGRLASAVLPGFVLDPAVLFAALPSADDE